MMEEEETFYDSLEDDEITSLVEQINQRKKSKEKIILERNSVEELNNKLKQTDDNDLRDIVPLYRGDITISSLPANRVRKKIVHRPTPVYILTKNPKKSYLDIYYDKLKRQGLHSQGSDTTRAIATPTPRSPLDSYREEPYICLHEETSDNESFYSNYLEKERTKNNSSLCASVKSVSTVPESKKHLNIYSNRDSYQEKNSDQNNIKLELLKKRQNYGKKVSAWNKIKMEESKILKKIKNSSIEKVCEI